MVETLDDSEPTSKHQSWRSWFASAFIIWWGAILAGGVIGGWSGYLIGAGLGVGIYKAGSTAWKRTNRLGKSALFVASIGFMFLGLVLKPSAQNDHKKQVLASTRVAPTNDARSKQQQTSDAEPGHQAAYDFYRGWYQVEGHPTLFIQSSQRTPGYIWFLAGGMVRVEVPTSWEVNSQKKNQAIARGVESLTSMGGDHAALLSAHSTPLPSTNFVRVSFLQLQPPITQKLIREEVQADPQQAINDFASSWNQGAAAMWAGMARAGVSQVGHPSFSTETVGGQIALVVRYARTVPHNRAYAMRVEQYHVALGDSEALITLSYLDGDQNALAAYQGVKNSIVIRTPDPSQPVSSSQQPEWFPAKIANKSKQQPTTSPTREQGADPLYATNNPKFDNCYAQYMKATNAISSDAPLGDYTNLVDRERKKMAACLR